MNKITVSSSPKAYILESSIDDDRNHSLLKRSMQNYCEAFVCVSFKNGWKKLWKGLHSKVFSSLNEAAPRKREDTVGRLRPVNLEALGVFRNYSSESIFHLNRAFSMEAFPLTKSAKSRFGQFEFGT